MRQWTIDAFAAEPFKGNQACVVEPFDAWPTDAWMQALAAENNQAETAFVLRTSEPDRFGLRWFTPALEVPLCGHATLAAGHVLLGELSLATPAVAFDTRSGALTVRREARDGSYAMDFPSRPPERVQAPPGLAAALGATPAEVWAGAYVIAILDSEAAVRGLRPDIGRIGEISAGVTGDRGNLGVAAMADAGQRHDAVSRFFAPGSGIAEDPATGSLHCILAPLFAGKLGRARIRFHQAYPGRGGDFDCEVRGERVILRGRAITMIDSRLRLDSA